MSWQETSGKQSLVSFFCEKSVVLLKMIKYLLL